MKIINFVILFIVNMFNVWLVVKLLFNECFVVVGLFKVGSGLEFILIDRLLLIVGNVLDGNVIYYDIMY